MSRRRCLREVEDEATAVLAWSKTVGALASGLRDGDANADLAECDRDVAQGAHLVYAHLAKLDRERSPILE